MQLLSLILSNVVGDPKDTSGVYADTVPFDTLDPLIQFFAIMGMVFCVVLAITFIVVFVKFIIKVLKK